MGLFRLQAIAKPMKNLMGLQNMYRRQHTQSMSDWHRQWGVLMVRDIQGVFTSLWRQEMLFKS
jgi:hypothetical protein